jgi:hypothetical protein
MRADGRLRPSGCDFSQCLVHKTCDALAHRGSCELYGRRDRRMRRHSAQKPKLVSSESQYVVEAAIGTLQVERTVQFALLTEHAGRQLVGEPAVALGEPGEVTVTRGVERRARADFAKDLESRATGGGSLFRTNSNAFQVVGSASGPES